VILGPPGDQVHPDWSPDGSQIAYVQRDGTGAQQILITDPQGTKPQPLLKDYPAKLSSLFWDNPSWSPDGSQIATVGYQATRRRDCPNDRCWQSSPWHRARSRSWASSSHPLVSYIASLAGRQPGMPSSSPWITSRETNRRWEDRGHSTNRCRLVEAQADHQGRRRTPRGLAPNR
jgi:Tol biopolymer transport system component